VGYFNEKRELKRLKKAGNYNIKGKKHEYLPAIIILIVIVVIAFIINLVNVFTSVKNFNINDIIFDIDISTHLNVPYNENDLVSAKTKLHNVGLETVANNYNLETLDANEQIPNNDLVLTNEEFEALLIPIYYAKYGKSTTIYEIAFTKVEEDINISVILSTRINLTSIKINFDKAVYAKKEYIFSKQSELNTKDLEYLNVNSEYLNTNRISETKTENDSIDDFLNFVLINDSENKSFIQLLNFTSFELEENNNIKLKV